MSSLFTSLSFSLLANEKKSKLFFMRSTRYLIHIEDYALKLKVKAIMNLEANCFVIYSTTHSFLFDEQLFLV